MLSKPLNDNFKEGASLLAPLVKVHHEKSFFSEKLFLMEIRYLLNKISFFLVIPRSYRLHRNSWESTENQ